MRLDKKGVLKAGILVLLAVMLLFFVVNGILSFAETAEEEKARLEAELGQLEGQLSAIDGGKCVNNTCFVGSIEEYREYLVKRISEIKERLKVLREEENNNNYIILLLTFKIKRKKRAQQSPTSLLNLSSSLHPEAISLKFRYVYKCFGSFLIFVILAYTSLKSYHKTSAFLSLRWNRED